MVLKNKNIQSGIFLLVVSVVMFAATLSFKQLTTSQVGPAFMPQIISVLIGLMSIAIIIEGYRKVKYGTEGDPEEEGEEDQDTAKEVSYRPVILSFVLMAIYVAVMPVVGFLITTMLYMFLQMMILSSKPDRRWMLFAIVSVVASSVIYYVFRNVFYIMLPSGLL
ncbi:Tripartite tricarboxylate transporter TctB family protein [Bhargavaea cecembensis DSE10]|uniref:Tripartite tricarboxylate transporter TctB family protein n=1 Tax=Bhargavaea cecembensis DSE10 TaxID=1235279 RepID=M7NIM3_9BACL|nr:tripartite tricarboxylate transporter TctB family protein [Bhargavaea cecembensis]EMR07001.1 Tripartite tricarboxylate transporter TctB family protein [Bhargavaea cecembensis DSE10]